MEPGCTRRRPQATWIMSTKPGPRSWQKRSLLLPASNLKAAGGGARRDAGVIEGAERTWRAQDGEACPPLQHGGGSQTTGEDGCGARHPHRVTRGRLRHRPSYLSRGRLRLGVRFQVKAMTPLTPAERDALRLRAAKADEVFSGRTVGELILDVRQTRADASAGLLGAALDAILAQCLAEPFDPWPGSLVAELVAP